MPWSKREALDIVIDTEIPGGPVVREPDRLIEGLDKPGLVGVDNGIKLSYRGSTSYQIRLSL